MNATLSRDYKHVSGKTFTAGSTIQVDRQLYKELLKGGYLIETKVIAENVVTKKTNYKRKSKK